MKKILSILLITILMFTTGCTINITQPASSSNSSDVSSNTQSSSYVTDTSKVDPDTIVSDASYDFQHGAYTSFKAYMTHIYTYEQALNYTVTEEIEDINRGYYSATLTNSELDVSYEVVVFSSGNYVYSVSITASNLDNTEKMEDYVVLCKCLFNFFDEIDDDTFFKELGFYDLYYAIQDKHVTEYFKNTTTTNWECYLHNSKDSLNEFTFYTHHRYLDLKN
ncbi:MAG: hypothetical protein ACI4II_01895 [Acutalibacteraceae bacterium]